MMQLLYIWATYIYRKCLNDFPLSWWYGNRNQIYVNEFVTRFCGIINHMIRRKKEYLYLYNWKVIFLVKSTHHHNPRNRRSFSNVYDDVISSFVFCFGSDAHKNIQYLFLCFVWFIYVALWNQIYPSLFSVLCYIRFLIFRQCRIRFWKSSFSIVYSSYSLPH